MQACLNVSRATELKINGRCNLSCLLQLQQVVMGGGQSVCLSNCQCSQVRQAINFRQTLSLEGLCHSIGLVCLPQSGLTTSPMCIMHSRPSIKAAMMHYDVLLAQHEGSGYTLKQTTVTVMHMCHMCTRCELYQHA